MAAWGPVPVERAPAPDSYMSAGRASALAALAARNPWPPGGAEPFGQQEREAQARYQRAESLLRAGVGDARAEGLIETQRRRVLGFPAHGGRVGLDR